MWIFSHKSWNSRQIGTINYWPKTEKFSILCLEDASWKFFKVKINLLLITRVIFGPFKITMSHWDNSYTIKFKTSVVTQFWIHQDFLECYFISIIIYKNKKIKKKFKIKKNNKKIIIKIKIKINFFFSCKPHLSIRTESTKSIRVKPSRPG